MWFVSFFIETSGASMTLKMHIGVIQHPKSRDL